MKKTICLVLAALLSVTALAACGGKASPEVSVDYGTSELYSQADMDSAMDRIRKEFSSWKGCELHSLRYAGDECMSEENLSWMVDLGDGESFTECIEFLSDFHSPVKGGDAWEPDHEYTNWQWWLARTEGGEWQLMTWGY